MVTDLIKQNDDFSEWDKYKNECLKFNKDVFDCLFASDTLEGIIWWLVDQGLILVFWTRPQPEDF